MNNIKSFIEKSLKLTPGKLVDSHLSFAKSQFTNNMSLMKSIENSTMELVNNTIDRSVWMSIWGNIHYTHYNKANSNKNQKKSILMEFIK